MSKDPVPIGHGTPLTTAALLILFLGSLVSLCTITLPPTSAPPTLSFPSLLLSQLSACLFLRAP